LAAGVNWPLTPGIGSVKTLVDIQQDVSIPAGVRRRSARDVLELGIRYREISSIIPRLEALEQQAHMKSPLDEETDVEYSMPQDLLLDATPKSDPFAEP